MWGISFKRAIATLSLVVLAAGLYFAFDQARKIGASIDASTWTSLAGQTLEIDRIFIDHPEMRKYFFGSKDIVEGEANYDLAESIAAFQLDFIDNFFAFQPHLAPENYDPEPWDNYFAATFAKSPVMCRVMKRDFKEYGDDILEIAKKACKWQDRDDGGKM